MKYKGQYKTHPANELNSDAANRLMKILDGEVLTIAEMASKTGFSITHVRNSIFKFESSELVCQVPVGLLQIPTGRGRPATHWTTTRNYYEITRENKVSLGEIVIPRLIYTMGDYSGQLSEFFEAILSRDSIIRTMRNRLAGIIATIMRQSLIPNSNMTEVKTDFLAFIEYTKNLTLLMEQIYSDPDVWVPGGADFRLLSVHDRNILLTSIEKYAMLYDSYLNELKNIQLLENLEN